MLVMFFELRHGCPASRLSHTFPHSFGEPLSDSLLDTARETTEGPTLPHFWEVGPSSLKKGEEDMIKAFRCPDGKGDLPFQECLKCAASHSAFPVSGLDCQGIEGCNLALVTPDLRSAVPVAPA